MPTQNSNGGPSSPFPEPGHASMDGNDAPHPDNKFHYKETVQPGLDGVLPARVEKPAAEGGGAEEVQGAFKILVTNKNGEAIYIADGAGASEIPDPNAPEAVHIYFAVTANPLPTAQQVELQDKIDKVVRACDRLYLKSKTPQPDSFRIYFVRLFFLAQLALEKNMPPEFANSLLSSITSDLIEDEAATMKNGHLVKLGRYALYYSILPLLVYLAVKLLPADPLFPWLERLEINPDFLSGFAMLWVGCFIGVWLSYGIRKTKISLTDLTLSEADYLAPHIRMVFAGLLTMILGILFALNFIDLRIGEVSLTGITTSPLSAFLVGLFCGISEAALPASIGSRAATFIQNIK